MKETETLDTRKALAFVLGVVPDFVKYDPEMKDGQLIGRAARHDGTALHSDYLKGELFGEVGRTIFLAKYLGATLRVSAITIETEFLGIGFSRENENTGMTEEWSIRMALDRDIKFEPKEGDFQYFGSYPVEVAG